MSEKREFTGVFIPAHIWVSKDLIPAEKMILGEIDALSKSRGYCDASRQHFADWLDCTPQNISYFFAKLEKLGFIVIEKVPGYRSKIWPIASRFYENQGVNGTDGRGKRDLPLPVNGTDGRGKRDLPEIQVIINNKEKEKEGKRAHAEIEMKEVKKPKKEKAPRLRRTPRSSPELTGADYIALLAARAESERMEGLVSPCHPDPAEIGVDRNIDPAGWATALAVRFMEQNTATVDSWISQAKATHLPTPESIESDIRLFFGHYQGKNGRSHSCYNTPVFYFQANYYNWIVMGVARDRENKERAAQNAKRGQSNQNGNSDFNNRRSNTTINNLTC